MAKEGEKQMNNDLGEIECFVLFCFHFGTFSHLSWHYKLSSSLLEVHIYTLSEDVYICQRDVTEYEYITIARKVHRASFMYALSFLSASKRHADRWIGNSKLRQGVSECACVCAWHPAMDWQSIQGEFTHLVPSVTGNGSGSSWRSES